MWKRERIGLEIKKVGCVTAEIMWSDTEEEYADGVIQDYIDDLISKWKEAKEKWKHSTNH